MIASLRLASTLLALVPAVAAPDLLMPGERRIEHTLVIEDSGHFERLALFAAPVAGLRGHARITPGEPFSFSGKYGTRIYAFESGALPSDLEGFFEAVNRQRNALFATDEPVVLPDGVLAIGVIPVQHVDSVPIASPVESMLTRLRIAGLENGRIELAVLDLRREWDVGALALSACAASVGILGLVVLVARRRRESSATT